MVTVVKLKLWLVVSLVLVVVSFGGYKFIGYLKPVPTPTPAPITAVLSYTFIADETKTDETAFSVLKAYLDKNTISYTTKSYDFGIFVESINGKVSGSDMAWIYYVNGQSGSVAADKYLLKPTDKVEWKYEKPQF